MYTPLLVAAFVACVAGDAIPDFVKPGKCAPVNLQNNFDLRKYSGRWYWTHMMDNLYMPIERCSHSNYEYSEIDYGFAVTTAGFSPSNEYLRLQGKIYPTKEFPTAHMLLDFPTVFAAPYKVIETDYETYSCIYSCMDSNDFKSEFGFVFSRSPVTDGLAEAKCAAVFSKNGIDFSLFNRISHTAECAYRA
ncbi:hypothetical protein Pmani_007125 [Petrolisthes manimaculis]|uniref:Lipocalin/cytosolic fatty-acid binding domain-containing protein n=1 Tax=Petrolisthes manimaculis TaxID=1843537 RepID=A0AAE1UFX1_9EUCA|nr:hypothetical protein Pmani_007125 [Petrolisthes manimaculis]